MDGGDGEVKGGVRWEGTNSQATWKDGQIDFTDSV